LFRTELAVPVLGIKMNEKYKIIEDEFYHYKRLDPLPSDETITDFYKDTYYQLIKNGERGVDINRSLKNSPEATEQNEWLSKTLYSDINYIINTHAKGNKVLEVGCGLGDLLVYLNEQNLDVEGIEIASAALSVTKKRNLRVHEGTFETLACGKLKNKKYNTIIFISVLEQIRNPELAIKFAKNILAPGGLIIIRSGNDYNPLQIIARDKLNLNEWWVNIPDHLYYFSFDSISKILTNSGFEIAYKQSDFPMEIFLLLGSNYVEDQEIGKDCHRKRVEFEIALSDKLRRSLYHAFAEAGIGRCALVVGRLL